MIKNQKRDQFADQMQHVALCRNMIAKVVYAPDCDARDDALNLIADKLARFIRNETTVLTTREDIVKGITS